METVSADGLFWRCKDKTNSRPGGRAAAEIKMGDYMGPWMYRSCWLRSGRA